MNNRYKALLVIILFMLVLIPLSCLKPHRSAHGCKNNNVLEQESSNFSRIYQSGLVYVTMYNLGDPTQTDNSPCVGSTMIDLCRLNKYINICASNCYPMGTRIKVEGLGECLVLDRMNKRYGCEVLDWAVDLGEDTSSNYRNIVIIK